MKINLIGVSGKIGSGKDTVGKIIQWLTLPEEVKDLWLNDVECFLQESSNLEDDSEYNWQIKKFADKLKDIVCLLIGCTREQLEDEEFKNTELGEEWWFYNVDDGISTNTVIKSYHDHKIDDLHRYYLSVSLIKPTPRFLLQNIGTNLLRNQLHPNTWVNATFGDYIGEPDDNSMTRWEPSKWIITDVRFPNEAQAIKDRGGITIRVNRPQLINRDFEHESETALDDYQDWNYVIDNNSTIEDLIKKVKEILIKEKVI